jgi:hypothetical protein
VWIRSHTKNRSYLPRQKTGFREKLRKEKKEVASRFFQFLTGHALTAPYLWDKLHKRESDECWWCESGQRQTREHLFKECSHWLPQIRELWRAVAKATGWRQAKWKSIARLFQEDKATEAVLDFLKQTDVGKVRSGAVPVEE